MLSWKGESTISQTGNASPSTQTGPSGDANKPKTILVIDDNILIVKTLGWKLKEAGYKVITARDGGEGVSLARKERPDLIVLDIMFPPDVGHGGGVPWDGFLIMDWLKRMEEAKNIPVVVMTSGDPAKYKDRAMSAGANGFFHKPIEMRDFLGTIQNILGPEPPKGLGQAA